MQLVVPGLLDFPSRSVGDAMHYELTPTTNLEVYPLVILPADVAQWGRNVLGADARRGRIYVNTVVENQTELGWPVTVSVTELLDETTGAPIEYRLHILFTFLDRGGVVIMRARDAAGFNGNVELVLSLIPHIQPDFADGEVAALASVWAGL